MSSLPDLQSKLGLGLSSREVQPLILTRRSVVPHHMAHGLCHGHDPDPRSLYQHPGFPSQGPDDPQHLRVSGCGGTERWLNTMDMC